MKKISLIQMTALTLMTTGLYLAWWLWTSREAINRLQSSEKLEEDALSLPLLLFGTGLFVNVCILIVLAGFGDPAKLPAMYALTGICHLSGLASIWVYSFKIRRILQEDWGRAGGCSPLSEPLTWFFPVFYFQYRINRFERAGNDERRVI